MTSIRTERLFLRRAELADVDALHEMFSDKTAMRYWSTLPHNDVEETRAFVQAMQGLHDAGGAEFVVEHSGTPIGKAGLWDPPEIGFIFHPGSWGQGFAREAASAVIRHGFTRMALAQITADVDPRNGRSLRLLTGLGFTQTGRAKATFTLGDEVCDSIYLALRREDWLGKQ